MKQLELDTAVAMVRNQSLSVARAARLTGMSVSEFITHVSRLGIPVVDLDAEQIRQDMETLEAWLTPP
jgi:predicted HTH domain antitoxin